MGNGFQKKYMHPTRRKLVDLVKTGKYESDVKVGYVGTNDTQHREIGETWVDSDGVHWEQKNGYRIKKNSLTDVMAEVREQLYQANRCKGVSCEKKGKYGPTDKKLIRKTGFCSSCLAHKEWEVKRDGLWEEYETYRLASNMISHGREVIAQLENAYAEAKQEYEFTNGDGKIEKWSMERDVEELKAEILIDINNIKDELEEVIQKRDDSWEKIKDKNYDLLKPPVD